MRRYFRLILCFCALLIATAVAGQTIKWQELYKVKKKDTIYGIAKKFNITIDELIRANPAMQKADYALQKGDQLLIPYPATKPATATTPATKTANASAQGSTTHKRAADGTVRIGVMLPLHNVDGDGQRMVEYYRGVLMACDSLRSQGIATHVYAWNVPIDANVQQTINDDNARQCDIIFGPLYTKQVKPIGDFCRKNGIRLVFPFSINGNDVAQNEHIYQVFQTPAQQNEASINAFVQRFKGRHIVIVDCNDTTSRKGVFTFNLRKRLEKAGTTYSITNLKSTEASFAKAFSTTLPNVVVLNSRQAQHAHRNQQGIGHLAVWLHRVADVYQGIYRLLLQVRHIHPDNVLLQSVCRQDHSRRAQLSPMVQVGHASSFASIRADRIRPRTVLHPWTAQVWRPIQRNTAAEHIHSAADPTKIQARRHGRHAERKFHACSLQA